MQGGMKTIPDLEESKADEIVFKLVVICIRTSQISLGGKEHKLQSLNFQSQKQKEEKNKLEEE